MCTHWPCPSHGAYQSTSARIKSTNRSMGGQDLMARLAVTVSHLCYVGLVCIKCTQQDFATLALRLKSRASLTLTINMTALCCSKYLPKRCQSPARFNLFQVLNALTIVSVPSRAW